MVKSYDWGECIAWTKCRTYRTFSDHDGRRYNDSRIWEGYKWELQSTNIFPRYSKMGMARGLYSFKNINIPIIPRLTINNDQQWPSRFSCNTYQRGPSQFTQIKFR